MATMTPVDQANAISHRFFDDELMDNVYREGGSELLKLIRAKGGKKKVGGMMAQWPIIIKELEPYRTWTSTSRATWKVNRRLPRW